MNHRRIFLVLLAVVCCGAPDSPLQSRLSMDHGLKPGSTIIPTPVACLHGANRTVGAPGEIQIVTFATPYDCTACEPHLSGISEVERAEGLEQRAFLVVWSPRVRTIERDLGPRVPELPICVNANGALWDRYDLFHTPFTAMIRDGKVIYMNDGALITRHDRADLASDLRRALAR